MDVSYFGTHVFVFYEMIDVGCVIAEYVLVGGLVMVDPALMKLSFSAVRADSGDV